MLHDAHRTSAPRLTRVSINTAVWTVMCSDPEIRAPRSGNTSAYSRRSAIKPGISCCANRISLRPNSARPRSATAKSIPARLWSLLLWMDPVSAAGATVIDMHSLVDWGIEVQRSGTKVRGHLGRAVGSIGLAEALQKTFG